MGKLVVPRIAVSFTRNAVAHKLPYLTVFPVVLVQLCLGAHLLKIFIIFLAF